MDLGAVLDRAGPQITELLATSGMTVALRVPVDPASAVADPATLTAVAVPNTPYSAAVPAILVETQGSSDGKPARGGNTPYARVVIGPDWDVADRTEVVVEASRDSRLVGRVYAVKGIVRNVAGIVQVLSGELVR